jgi:hypothetical protein
MGSGEDTGMTAQNTPNQYQTRRILLARKLERGVKLCINCLARTRPTSGRLCQPCAAWHNAKTRRVQMKRLRAGFCLYCGGNLSPYSKRECPRHLEMSLHRNQKRAARFLAAGVCVVCGAELASTSHRRCDVHLELQREYNRRYNARKGRGMLGRRFGGTGMGVRLEHTAMPGPRL